ncbi:MFS transporter, partial [Pseudomonas aeruginosa]
AATLIVWRLCQGLAGGLLIPLGQAMAYRNVPASARAGLTARVMLVALIVPAVAPALGGWLVDSLSWRGIFFASVASAAEPSSRPRRSRRCAACLCLGSQRIARASTSSAGATLAKKIPRQDRLST